MKLPFGLGLFAITALLVASVTSAADITGAGATFPYPIFGNWGVAKRKKPGLG